MHFIEDVQGITDKRNLPIQHTGIKRLRHPITVQDQTATKQLWTHASIAYFDMFVELPAEQKGTHMSRFVEMLNAAPVILSTQRFPALLDNLITRLEVKNGSLQADFPIFIEKTAPVSKSKSLMDYQITLKASLLDQKLTQQATIHVPVTSLCPCSKKISNYGAHNQRSSVIAQIEYTNHLSLIDIIHEIEAEASCELYALLKRPDEKFVTERAYDNPKFVEDMVRDVIQRLQKFEQIQALTISSENYESIHNHSAYAEITWSRYSS